MTTTANLLARYAALGIDPECRGQLHEGFRQESGLWLNRESPYVETGSIPAPQPKPLEDLSHLNPPNSQARAEIMRRWRRRAEESKHKSGCAR